MLGAEDEKAKVEITGNEKLQSGVNNIKITVTAEDGTVKTYSITATKEAAEKLQLSKLQITGVNLNETFKPDKYEYTVNLKENLSKLDIKLAANDENATIEVLGNENLTEGENVVTIMVKSKDGTENVTYQIIVNKLAKSNNGVTASESNSNNKLFIYVAIGIFAVALILIIIVVVRSIKKSKEDFEDNFDNENESSSENNYTEELYSTRKENKDEQSFNENINLEEDIYKNKNEDLYQNSNDNKLYDVEKEVDFSEEEEKSRRRKGGKHSK